MSLLGILLCSVEGPVTAFAQPALEPPTVFQATAVSDAPLVSEVAAVMEIDSHVAASSILNDTAPAIAEVLIADSPIEDQSRDLVARSCSQATLDFDLQEFFFPVVAEICSTPEVPNEICLKAMLDYTTFGERAAEAAAVCSADTDPGAREADLLAAGITTLLGYQSSNLPGADAGIAKGLHRLTELWSNGSETAKEVLSAFALASFDAPEDDAPLAAIPGLNSREKREILDGLAIVKFRNDTMASSNAGLNANVVPQLIRLLANTDEEIPQLAMARLVAIGPALTEANRVAATRALEAYRRRNTNRDVQTDIDAALRVVRPPPKK